MNCYDITDPQIEGGIPRALVLLPPALGKIRLDEKRQPHPDG